MSAQGAIKRRWRYYATPAGHRPVAAFIAGLSDLDAAEVIAAMTEVRQKGTSVARHLDKDIWEVRAEGPNDSYRVLFATEGKKSRILLGVHAFPKHTQKTPDHHIELAQRRLADWRRRGRARRQPPQQRDRRRP